MLVGDRMSHPVITIQEDVPVQEALAQMHKEHVHRFPVVDKRGKLIGIVSEEDLMNASPSEATTLSVWEINYLVTKITVSKVMAKNVITVTEDTPIEEAARIMADNNVGGLPVMRDGELVGIITETNLFKMFLEMFGARQVGIRMTILVRDVPGKLSELSQAINALGGNIRALGTFAGEMTGTTIITMKVSDVELGDLKNAITPSIVRMIDIRETGLS
jgi:acetoin utilization protein AcuB